MSRDHFVRPMEPIKDVRALNLYRCRSAIITPSTFADAASGQTTCHRKSNHRGVHRGWIRTFTGEKLVTWKRED